MNWRFDTASAIGGRAEQQDRVATFVVPGRHGGRVAVLADGMGGRQYGAEAAQTVVDTARRELQGLADGNPRACLTGFCEAAHDAIRALGRQYGANPASTCTALYLRRDEAYWIHVGDSRLYHFNRESQLFRTDDHNLGALMAGDDAGGARPARRRNDHHLYMCLGGHNELEPEYGAAAVAREDWFMLCSDGFWSQVRGSEAARRLTRSAARGANADALVRLAAERGGPGADNVSLVLATPARRLLGRWAVGRAWWRF